MGKTCFLDKDIHIVRKRYRKDKHVYNNRLHDFKARYRMWDKASKLCPCRGGIYYARI